LKKAFQFKHKTRAVLAPAAFSLHVLLACSRLSDSSVLEKVILSDCMTDKSTDKNVRPD